MAELRYQRTSEAPPLHMHKTAVAFALSHGLTLGRHQSGYYFLRHPGTLEITHTSLHTTAASALAMMRRALRIYPGDRVVLTMTARTVPT